MSQFLADNATIARLGVAFYPQLTGATITDPTSGNQSNFCSVTTTVDVPIVDSDDAAQDIDAMTVRGILFSATITARHELARDWRKHAGRRK